ncbi:MAG: fused MFS/spermidine synthase [Armatimonadota bacterium]
MDTHKRQTLTLVAYFLLGAISIIVQATLVREFLVVFYGNELCIGLTFGLWLFWIAAGAQLGAWVVPRVQRVGLLFFAAVLLGCLSVPVQVYLVRVARDVLHAPPGQLIAFGPMLLFTAIVLAPFSAMVGFTFPLGLKLYAVEEEKDARKIGWIYMVEAAGSLGGGLLFTFVLVTRLSAFAIVGVVLALGTVGAGGIALWLTAAPTRWRWAAAAVVGVLAALAGVYYLPAICPRLERETVRARFDSLGTKTELLHSADSKYQNIALSRLGDQYNLYLNGQYAAWFPDDYSYAAMANTVLSQHPDPKTVLLIGGGAEGLIEEMLKSPLDSIDYVELDPRLIATIRPFLPAEDQRALADPRVRVHYLDGRFFVKTTEQQYDLVFVNLPDPSTALLNRYYTLEFFAEVHRVLRPDGVFGFTLMSFATYPGGLLGQQAAAVWQTVAQVFPHVVLQPTERSCFFAATQHGTVTTDWELLAERFRQRGVQSEHFSPEVFAVYYYPGRAEQFQRRLAERTDVHQNTDLRPVSYFYNLLLWAEYSGSRVGKAFQAAQKVQVPWLVLALVALGILRLLWIALTPRRVQRHRRANYLFSVAACGFAAMGLEVILIFGFQNLYGYVYQMIGLLVALFMFGLAVGSWMVNMRLPRIRRGLGLLIGIEVGVVVFALLLPPTLEAFSARLVGQVAPWLSQAAFAVLIAITGLLIGLELPLASQLYLRASDRLSRTAGMVDAADHFGAFAGALAAGALLIPVFGMTATCAIVAVLNALAIAFLAATEVRARGAP